MLADELLPVPVAGGISEKAYVDINGVRQGMFIKGQNRANPVLLYLHGGMPEYFLNERYPTGLDEYFTVVWWEQRGSRLSYSANIRQMPPSRGSTPSSTRCPQPDVRGTGQAARDHETRRPARRERTR